MANNVYKFPGVEPARDALKKTAEPASIPKANRVNLFKRITQGGIKVLWFTLVLIWPVLRWVVALDVVYQAVVMMWHWNTPGTFAGWRFLLHFGVQVALTYFVSIYKPQGVK